MPFFNPNDDDDDDCKKFDIVFESGQWDNMKDVNDPTDNKSTSNSK
jgi:hypothetical protein